MKRFLAIAVGLAVGLTVAISFFSEDSHPDFGPIRSTQWIEPHSPSRFVSLVLEVRDTFGIPSGSFSAALLRPPDDWSTCCR